ncbi:hypothetical protein, partial [Novosphingobium sp. LASN5T]|uniref:hypothetical protein n=1 Tax=Novosphingobium sp. LASN5T TaxID=2491021 RepID=UPI001CC1DA45
GPLRICCRRAVSVQAMCFSIRLDNDGESHPADIAQLLSARALMFASSGETKRDRAAMRESETGNLTFVRTYRFHVFPKEMRYRGDYHAKARG